MRDSHEDEDTLKSATNLSKSPEEISLDVASIAPNTHAAGGDNLLTFAEKKMSTFGTQLTKYRQLYGSGRS